MKIDQRDLDHFVRTTEAQRDAFASRLAKLSVLARAKLATNEANSREVIVAVQALAVMMADIYVWIETASACEALLDNDYNLNESTMGAVIERVQKNYDDLIGSPLMMHAEPEFYPLRIEAYGKLIRHLKYIEAAGDLVENLCAQIGPDALDRFKEGDKAILAQTAKLAFRLGLEKVIESGGFTSLAQINEARETATALGFDPDALGVPAGHPVPEVFKGIDLSDPDVRYHVVGPASMSPDDFRNTAIQQIAAETGFDLSAAHLTEVSPGRFVLLVDEQTGKSLPVFDHLRQAELDGGAGSGLPRAPETPPLRSVPRYAEDSRARLPDADFDQRLDELGFPAASRRFGRRAADAARTE